MAKDTTINEVYNATQPQKLQDAIKADMCGTLTKGVCLLQDNSPVQNADATQMKAHSSNYDVHIFPTIKSFFERETLFG